MFAGNDTTTNLIRNEMLALLQNLDQLWLLQGKTLENGVLRSSVMIAN